MISSRKIIEEITKEKNNLFKSFFFSLKESRILSDVKKFKKFKTVIIIGMGGSILGSKAIYSFLKHKIKKKFIFVDNIDESFLKDIKKNYNLTKCLFLIISKSGNTSETLLNLNYFKSFLKKTNTIILSENKKNFLSNFAKKNGYFFIKHDPLIGGRYSIFSEVGMIPAFLMGLKIINFKKNLKKFINNKNTLSNSINKINKLNLKKTKILILFNYVPELNNFLYWLQQLYAESLGKNKKGFIPVVSQAPKDHHSLLQLYLDGPRNKVFYVFSSKKNMGIKTDQTFFEYDISYLKRKKLSDIKISQKDAFIKVLKEKKIPVREILINEFNEQTIGKLFFLSIFETIALGKIMKINPYDQPAVEEVKVLSKKFLSSKKF